MASLPVLDFRLTESPETKDRFLSELRAALVDKGFFYLKNHPIPTENETGIVATTQSFFSLPVEEKQGIDIANNKHFRGYACVGTERTATKSDKRETFTVGFEAPAPSPELPVYYNLAGPNQWPTEATAPGFRDAVETYLDLVKGLADKFVVLVAEALDINPESLTNLFDDAYPGILRIAGYPRPPVEVTSQGCGAHKDGSFLTFLLQGTKHKSLEVQDQDGTWIGVPPIPGTLVVNVGRVLEAITQGICVAATHRVSLNPNQYEDASEEYRVSVPYFHFPKIEATEKTMQVNIPDHIVALGRKNAKAEVEEFFKNLYNLSFGEAGFTNGLTNLPQVGERWFPKELAAALRDQQTSYEGQESTQMHNIESTAPESTPVLAQKA